MATGDIEVFNADRDTVKTEELRDALTGLPFTSDFVPFEQLYANLSRNVRLQQGAEVVPGFKFDHDTYDIGTLLGQVAQTGYIRDALTVSRKLIDGKVRDEVLQGFRRYLVAERVVLGGTNPALIAAMQRIPVKVYENLSPLQESQLINDQGSKEFAACEVLRDFWNALDNGIPWQHYALFNFEQIGRATGAASGEIQKIRQAKTESEKLDKLGNWLNSTLNQLWKGVYVYGGPRFQKWLFLTYADRDGLLSEDEKKASLPFPMTVSLWRDKIYKAVQADHAAGKWDKEAGTGPEVEACIAAIIAAKNKPRNPLASTKKFKSVEDVELMIGAPNRHPFIKSSLESVFQDSINYNLGDMDDVLNKWSGKAESYSALTKAPEQFSKLPASLQRGLALAFSSKATTADFDAFLAEMTTGATETVQAEPGNGPETVQAEPPVQAEVKAESHKRKPQRR